MIEALHQLLKEASLGDDAAIQTLLILFKEGTLSHSEEEQIHLYLKAQSHHHHAIYLRGVLYEYGFGVKKDLEMAFLLMRDAASKGHPKATYKVGHAFLEGAGVLQNYESALKWLTVASQSPYYVREAMYDLGHMYEKGLGVDVDLEKAREWYKKAAEKGHPLAKEKLL